MSENSLAPLSAWLVEPMEPAVAAAIERLRRAPDVRRVAVMPDVHLASEVCVGTVLATSQLVYPQAVGGDIGCGMLAVAFDVPAEALGSGVAVAVAPPAAQIKTRTKEVGFQVLTGSPGTLLESLEAGAAGAVLGFAACAPQACQEIYFAWKDHDLALAREKQERIAEPSQQIGGKMGISGIKYACDFNGYYGGKTRLPLLQLTAEQKTEIERLLTEIRN